MDLAYLEHTKGPAPLSRSCSSLLPSLPPGAAATRSLPKSQINSVPGSVTLSLFLFWVWFGLFCSKNRRWAGKQSPCWSSNLRTLPLNRSFQSQAGAPFPHPAPSRRSRTISDVPFYLS